MADYIHIEGKTVEANLTVYYLDEEGTIVAYCPSLDLSTYGDSLEDTQNAFQEAFQIFIEEVMRKGTLTQISAKQGWLSAADGFNNAHKASHPSGRMLQTVHQNMRAAYA